MRRSPLPKCLFYTPECSSAPYTLSLHDALPIFAAALLGRDTAAALETIDRAVREGDDLLALARDVDRLERGRSEEHTSELQSRLHLVCRLLLEKKNSSSHAVCARNQNHS